MVNVNDIKVFDWDEEFEDTGSDFTVIEEGTYPFTVKSLEKARYGGGAKMPPCPQANVTIELDVHGTKRVLADRFYLCETAIWRAARFFKGLGFVDENGRHKPRWNEVEGQSGWCKVGIRTWTGQDGKERESNEITAYLEPDEFEQALKDYTAGEQAAAQSAQQGWSL